MSSEEEDYMSPEFLEKCVKDVRPGLVKEHSKKRQYDLEAKKAKTLEKQKENAQKSSPHYRLMEGLKNPISSENKGFAMLAKMGYKQGDSLGKNQSGLKEPVGLTIKCDRTGLGRDNALKNLQLKRLEIRKRKLELYKVDSEKDLEEYRKRMRLQNEEKTVMKALWSCQRTCEKLDKDENYENPAMKWFWPEKNEEKTDEEEDDRSDDEKEEEEEEEIEEDYEPSEKLEMLNDYLRTTYRYCHWCGVKYKDDEDFKTNCPGPEKDDH